MCPGLLWIISNSLVKQLKVFILPWCRSWLRLLSRMCLKSCVNSIKVLWHLRPCQNPGMGVKVCRLTTGLGQWLAWLARGKDIPGLWTFIKASVRHIIMTCVTFTSISISKRKRKESGPLGSQLIYPVSLSLRTSPERGCSSDQPAMSHGDSVPRPGPYDIWPHIHVWLDLAFFAGQVLGRCQLSWLLDLAHLLLMGSILLL